MSSTATKSWCWAAAAPTTVYPDDPRLEALPKPKKKKKKKAKKAKLKSAA